MADTSAPLLPGMPPAQFTVSNLAGTVTVTVAIDGSVRHIDLDASVTKMTERELAEEIRWTVEVAARQALSNAHQFLVEGMRESGYASVEVGTSLTRGLGLPSAEQAAEATAREFSHQYSSDDDW